MVWRARYNYSHGNDEAKANTVDTAGNFFVTGRSEGLGFDFATVTYEQHLE
jgi:hypothetical protein